MLRVVVGKLLLGKATNWNAVISREGDQCVECESNDRGRYFDGLVSLKQRRNGLCFNNQSLAVTRKRKLFMVSKRLLQHYFRVHYIRVLERPI